MCNKNFLYVVLALVAVGSLLAGSASADTITVPNAGFENDVLADGGTLNMPRTSPTDWLATMVVGTGGTIQYYNPAGAMPAGGEGVNEAYWVFSSTRTPLITQTLVDTLQVGTYTLTVACGGIAAVGVGDFTIALGTTGSGGYLSQFDGSVLDVPYTGTISKKSTGAFTDHSVTLIVEEGNAYLNQPIVISFAARGAVYGDNAFDNVRLDGPAATPEPSTMVLLGTGLIGLLAYAWRKRK